MCLASMNEQYINGSTSKKFMNELKVMTVPEVPWIFITGYCGHCTLIIHRNIQWLFKNFRKYILMILQPMWFMFQYHRFLFSRIKIHFAKVEDVRQTFALSKMKAIPETFWILKKLHNPVATNGWSSITLDD